MRHSFRNANVIVTLKRHFLDHHKNDNNNAASNQYVYTYKCVYIFPKQKKKMSEFQYGIDVKFKSILFIFTQNELKDRNESPAKTNFRRFNMKGITKIYSTFFISFFFFFIGSLFGKMMLTHRRISKATML